MGIREGEPCRWHALSVEEAFRVLKSGPEGLASETARFRLKEYGPNALPAPHPPRLWRIVLHQFASPLIYVLLAAGAISVLIGEMTDAGFIFAVVLLNASLGAFQEWKAEKKIAAALQSVLRIRAEVRREGKIREISAEELVPGDLVLLSSGQRVPADLRLTAALNLSVDESLLTGESVAVEKKVEPLSPELPLGERRNLAFAGSTASTGRGVGVVVATGPLTEVGRIARAVTGAAKAKPPLLIRMERFAAQISYVVLGCVTILALVCLARGIPYLDIFFMAVALAVSSIPEGLPVAMTVALSIAASRMAKRNVVVRKLTAVEGLGSCTCIASDKTGTLTVNKQTAKILGLPGGRLLFVSGEGYSGEGRILTAEGEEPDSEESDGIHLLIEAAVLCNEASLSRDGRDWSHRGNAVDVACLALGLKAGLGREEVAARVEFLGEIPFESERKYAARFYRRGGAEKVAVKGAVEAVLPFCANVRAGSGSAPIDAERIKEETQALAERGYRVIGVAAGDLRAPFDPGAIPPLTFLGLIGLIDPLRPEVKPAVEKCRRAGVKVVMVTGDHPATALCIARELGIAESREDLVTGPELEEIGAADSPPFLERVKQATVFSRVTPLQKLEIVEALLRLGHFVAVTGDGVNDAPALRRANIGVAMGTGTDVAKDTAEILVSDDNFASIEAAVEEGRFAYDNIRKVIYLLISTGAAEIFLFTLALLARLPLPLLAVQLLWLNLVTNGIQDVALAFEGGEAGAMDCPPRPPKQGVFNRLMVEQCVLSGVTMGLLAFGTLLYLRGAGWEEDSARNMILLLMVLLENIHVFNCRSERISAFRVPLKRNRLLIAGVVVAQSVHILSLYIPFMREVLGVEPVSLRQWLILLLLGSVLLLVMEIYKLLKFRRKPGIR